MNNLWSYCGLVDPRISASDKDLPVPKEPNLELLHTMFPWLQSSLFCCYCVSSIKVAAITPK